MHSPEQDNEQKRQQYVDMIKKNGAQRLRFLISHLADGRIARQGFSTVKPPIYGCNASGINTLPSGC